jgi:hypothetical protein
VELINKLDNYTEVAATTANCPEEIGVGFVVCGEDRAISGHYCHLDKCL